MKFIENSVDAIKLQANDEEMASCEILKVNGESKKADVETDSKPLEKSKMSNGLLNKSVKTNGENSVFFSDDDEEFHLVMESSSEEGSPSKKIDDDISAEDLTKEITDLLGESSEGINEELKKIDSLKSVDVIEENETLINGEVLSTSLESKASTDSENNEAIPEVEKDKKKNLEELEKESSSSKIELVYENVDLEEEILMEEDATDNGSENKCDKQTNNNSDPESSKENNDIDAASGKENSKTGEVDNKLIDSSEEKPIVLSQPSSDSSGNDNWQVLDSVETSDEEEKPKCQKSLDEGSPSKASAPETIEEMIVISEVLSDTEVSEITKPGDASRKRSAAFEEDFVEQKKAKIEEAQTLVIDDSDLASKRHSSDLLENETKRTKLNGSIINEDLEQIVLDNTIGNNEVEISEFVENKTKTCEEKSESATTKLKKADTPESLIDEANSEDIVNKLTDVEKAPEFVIEESCEVSVDKHSEVKENSDLVAEEPSEEIPEVVKSTESAVEEQAQEEDKDSSKITSKESSMFADLSSDSSLESIPEMLESLNTSLSTTSLVDGVETIADKLIKSQTNAKEESCKETPKLEENKSQEEDSNNVKQSSTVMLKSEKNAYQEKNITSEKNMQIADCLESNEVKTKLTSEDSKTITKSIESRRASSSKETMEETTDSFSTHVQQSTDSSLKSVKVESKTNSLIETAKAIINEKISKQIPVIRKVEAPKRKFLCENLIESKTAAEQKVATNLEKSIENVVKKSRCSMFMVLKKFHKDQLRKMNRWELEEAVVMKICEAVTDKSEIGEMRQKYQALEQDLEIWKKKATQYEKQMRELDMVVKRFLTESESHQKDGKPPPLPIKVTRSVGLQVVLANSVNGTLVSSKSKQLQQQQQMQRQQQQLQLATKQKLAEKMAKEQQVKAASTYMPPVQQNSSPQLRGRGRPPRRPLPPAPTLTPTPIAPATAPPTIHNTATPPVKSATSVKPSPPVKSTPPGTSSTNLEVIDLTDKEEKSKPVPQSPTSSGGGIRVAPQTQVCFVQQPNASNTSPQMAYIVQKPGQRQQYLVSTSSASPSVGVASINLAVDLQPKPTQTTRPPPALAVPLYRNIPATVSSPSQQVAVRTQSPANTPPRPVVQTVRPIALATTTTKKHPAPLPSAPPIQRKPGLKLPPTKPLLKIAKTATGIMLSWSMTLTDNMADMASYQLYAYQENNQPPTTSLWKKVGDVKALPLPMACTLTQFIEGHKYHFAVRAMDVHGRIGPFSHPGSILLKH